jgi:hypothetical protein
MPDEPDDPPIGGRRHRVMIALGVTVSVVAVAASVTLALSSGPSPRNVTIAAAPPAAVFVPPTHTAGADTGVTLTFADGTAAELTYPSALQLAEQGFTPYAAAVSWPVQDLGAAATVNACCNRELSIGLGAVPAAYAALTGTPLPSTPTKTYPGAAGPVAYYETTESADLVFAFGSWVVLERDYPAGSEHADVALTDEQRAVFARTLAASITTDGYLVLQPRSPLRLAKAAEPVGVFGERTARYLAIIDRPCSADASDRSPSGYRIEPTGDSGQLALCTDEGYVVHAVGDAEFLDAVAARVTITRVEPPPASTAPSTPPTTATPRSTTSTPSTAPRSTTAPARDARDAVVHAFHDAYTSGVPQDAKDRARESAAELNALGKLAGAYAQEHGYTAEQLAAITIAVTDVTFVDPTHATVHFTLTIPGHGNVLTDYPGYAVFLDDRWQVARRTSCELLGRSGSGVQCAPEPGR